MCLGQVGNCDIENACVDVWCLGRDSVCSLMEQSEKCQLFTTTSC